MNITTQLYEALREVARLADNTVFVPESVYETLAAYDAIPVVDEREGFERWAKAEGYSVDKFDNGFYVDDRMPTALRAWKARAALSPAVAPEREAPQSHGDEPPHQARTLALLSNHCRVAGGYISHEGSYVIDWDEDSKRQLCIGVKSDGRIFFARYIDGAKTNGQFDCDGETLPPEIVAQLDEFFGTGPPTVKQSLTVGAREEFEAIVRKICGDRFVFSTYCQHEEYLYSDSDLQRMFLVWKSAKATAAPERVSNSYTLPSGGAPKAVAPASGRHFSFGDEYGFDTHDTAEAARKAADDAIDGYRDTADDGWDEGVRNICWGVVLGSADVISRQLIPDFDLARFDAAPGDEYLDYGLIDYAALPADARDAVQCVRCAAKFPKPPEPHCYCPACCRADSDRLSDIESEHWRVEPLDMPTGAGDADVGWRVYAYHQSKPDVLVAEVFEDDVRAVIDAASGIDRDRAMGAKDGQS